MAGKMFDISFALIIYMTTINFVPAISKIYKFSFLPKRIEEFFVKLTRDAIELRKNGTVKRDDFLNYLLQLREKKDMSDVELTAHTMTFFLDGFESSSYVISNVLTRLAANPEVQNKLRDELMANLKDDESISFDQINELPYLDQVFHGEHLHQNHCKHFIDISY